MLQLSDSLSVYLQKRVLFRPVELELSYKFQFDVPFEEHFIDTGESVRLNALFFPNRMGISRGVVLYFHGNRGNLQRWGQLHADFTGRGFDFFVMDYRGYGKSGGEPGERTYFEDARRAYDWLLASYPPERIVLYGRSLGAAMASYLAAHVRAKSVVLETPFNNIPGLFASYFKAEGLPFRPAFQFPNDRHLRQTILPVLILHGGRDQVVPYASAAALRACLKPGDRFVHIEEGSHNNLREFAAYQEALDAWL